jgi:hypothetical protein
MKIKENLGLMNLRNSERIEATPELQQINNQKYASEFNSSNTYNKRDNESNKF